MTEPLLKVQDLKTSFYTEDGVVKAVDGVSFTVDKGQTLGVVGESGCGKSITAFSIMRLIPNPPGKIEGGEIIFAGENLLTKSEAEMRAIRGDRISMIFQEPMTSLDPLFTVGDQITEAIMLHQKLKNSEAREKAIEMLCKVGIPSPEKRVDEYPHQLSGGMRQRVMIAIALSCNPQLLIADEPTTALDVTIQAQILELLMKLKKDSDMAIIMITHDLGVVAEVTDKTAVMYAGQILEATDTVEIFANPLHPYTLGLLGSIPRLHEEKERLQTIEGSIPNPLKMPTGCRFHLRCPYVKEICIQKEPAQVEASRNHLVKCWRSIGY